MTFPIRKGERFEAANGYQREAPGDGAIIGCAFVADEELVAALAALGWKCRKRKGDDAGERPDVLG